MFWRWRWSMSSPCCVRGAARAVVVASGEWCSVRLPLGEVEFMGKNWPPKHCCTRPPSTRGSAARGGGGAAEQ
eukprot:8240491-Lingulodinium_polyedra.AAC.1